jgi:hypothetical protein
MDSFHFVTVGMSPSLVRDLWDRAAARGHLRVSHIAHPSFSSSEWSAWQSDSPVRFFGGELLDEMPAADRDLLASLEGAELPTVHNMIMSDRFVSALPYESALRYATFLTNRLLVLYRELKPSAIIGGFDSLHGSLGFAVARREGIPWFALMFSSLPAGQVAVCSNLLPSSAITFEPGRVAGLLGTADQVLRNFENRAIEAAAYIPPKLLTLSFILKQLPVQVATLPRVIAKGRRKHYLRFTNAKNTYSLGGLIHEAVRLRKNVWRMPHEVLHQYPGDRPYAFFGLHTQPESSVDVWAHFFSNQLQVIEMMARSMPPTHTLYVKLHKSDIPNYSRAALGRMLKIPGVKLVSPGADTYKYIRDAAIIFSIQGTIGLEGALFGKPVIMFGDSPVKIFPSVTTFGRTIDLPSLVRQKLVQPVPSRDSIVEALASYLAPFYPGSSNDWTQRPTDLEIDGYVRVFRLLEEYVATPSGRTSGVTR